MLDIDYSLWTEGAATGRHEWNANDQFTANDQPPHYKMRAAANRNHDSSLQASSRPRSVAISARRPATTGSSSAS
jgi:hypothetical protein